MELTRRDFLQRIGWTIAALGMSEAGLVALADRYGQVLAQPTRRKLALLVGINEYPESVCDFVAKGSALTGCLTDVELQRQLLIHRFGFQPADILTLTDEQATREAIATAFQTHLIDQAQADDGVVIHISGLGSQVRSSSDPSHLFNTIVPVDGVLPTDEQSSLNDLMVDTLELLVRSLPTRQVTTILDLSYAPSGTPFQGTLRGRSRPNAPTGQISPAELTLQTQLRSHLKRSNTSLKAPFPGALLTAVGGDQIALEGQWSGFSAGLFTYALTQTLWGAAPAQTLRWVFSQTGSAIQTLSGTDQTPTLTGQAPQSVALSTGTNGAFGAVSQRIAPSADGVIISAPVDSKSLQIWAGGLAAPLLECYDAGALLGFAGHNQQVLRVQGRQGLVLDVVLEDRLPNRSADKALISGETVSGLQGDAIALVGQLVQERVRLIPRQANISVALDSSLERVERVDATSALKAAKVLLANPDEISADYLFGKTTAPTLAATLPLNADAPDPLPPPKGSFGLFYPGRVALPNALFSADEAVKTAVNRLSSQLRSLQALKLLRLTHNATSSRLSVGVTLEQLTSQPQFVAQQFTTHTLPQPSYPLTTPTSTAVIPLVAPGSQIQYRLQNYGDRPLYIVVLSIDSAGRAIALPSLSAAGSPVPLATEPTLKPALPQNSIPPHTTLTLPQDLTHSTWTVQGDPRRVETYFILSPAPFKTAAVLLQAPPTGGTLQLTNPLQIVQAVLHDLHTASTAATPYSTPADAYALNVNCWATLGFTYHVRDAFEP